MRSRSALTLRLLFASWLALTPFHRAAAEELIWIGATDSSWHTPTNWAPITVPGQEPIQRVPQDGDTVLIADPMHGSQVTLYDDAARLAGLTVAGGMKLDSNGHSLHVENGGTARTVIRGEGSRLELPVFEPDATVFQTDLLDVLEGGTWALLDDTGRSNPGSARILHGGYIDATSQLTGRGTPVFGSETTPAETVLLRNEGTIRPLTGRRPGISSGLAIAAAGGGLVDYDGQSELGVIDADDPRQVSFEGTARHSDPYSGTLAIGAGDRVYWPGVMEDARIELNGADEDPATLSGYGGQLQLLGTSSIQVNSGLGFLEADGNEPQSPQFQMVGGSVHVHENATLAFRADTGSYDLSGTSFVLDNGSTLDAGSYESITLTFTEFDLDGGSRPATISIHKASRLTINAQQVDNDAESPGFDGHWLLSSGHLQMNLPAGWELDGRLDIVSPSSVSGSTIIIDGGDADDGLYFVDAEYSNEINSNLYLTENAQITNGSGGEQYFNGNVTNFRRELSSGFGALVFRGDVTVFAVPTTLSAGAVFERGVVELKEDLSIAPEVSAGVGDEASLLGPGSIINDGFFFVEGGANVDSPIVNRGSLSMNRGANVNSSVLNSGAIHVWGSGDPSAVVAELDLGAGGRLQFTLDLDATGPALKVEERLVLDGPLEISHFADVRDLLGHEFEIISATGGIDGQFTSYDFEAPGQRLFWRVHSTSTSLFVEAVLELVGDYNDNGTVEQGDLDLVLLHWGQDAIMRPDGWTNDWPSGYIDQDELDRVLLGWGDVAVVPAAAGAAAVAEPTSTCISVLVFVLASTLGRQFRH